METAKEVDRSTEKVPEESSSKRPYPKTTEILMTEEEETDKESPNKKVRRNSYTLKFKLTVLDTLHNLKDNYYATAKVYKPLTRCNIMRWHKQEAEIRSSVADRSTNIRARRTVRKDEGGFRQKFPVVESNLLSWFVNQRNAGLPVNQEDLQVKAIEIFIEQNTDRSIQFKASNGWLQRFLKRSNLTMRQATSIGQKIPANVKDLILNFFEYLEKFKSDKTVLKHVFVNMDETPLWMDAPRTRSYDVKGTNSISIATTGHEKLRFTVVLSGDSDGRKFKPMIIFKNLKKTPKGKFPGTVYVRATPGGSMTTDLMRDWRKEVFAKRDNIKEKICHAKTGSKTILVMDAYPAHRDKSLIGEFKHWNNTEVAIIPGGCTPLLQPADVVWNRPFKNAFKNKWNKWMEFQPRNEVTGKRKRASYHELVQWVDECWKEIPVALIQQSFISCGLTTVQDHQQLHGKLKNIINGQIVNEIEDLEKTGLTDDENDEDLNNPPNI